MFDSMFPTLQHGDTILVDRRVNQVAADGIYVLRWAGRLAGQAAANDAKRGNPGDIRQRAVRNGDRWPRQRGRPTHSWPGGLGGGM
ncbi:MAG: S24 family peptidase [Magnetococcales bacterium]|nr:S24 family peptidase [Magnetococcales bacterium]